MNIPFSRLFCLSAVMTLAGCAGMPEMKNLPIGSSIASFVPGGASTSSLIDTGLSVAKDVSDASKEMPDSEEIELGENIMAGVLGAAPLHANDRIQRYVNQVGRWIAMNSERPNLPWRFAVLESPLPNAGAAPGGQIYITTGLLFRMRNEAELAGALAHEVAHVVQRHHVKAYQKQKLGSAGASIAGAVVDSKVKTGGLGGAAAKTVLKLGIGEVRKLILFSLDRGEEEQADRMGMTLAARSGYDPYGLPSVLQILQDLQKDQGGASLLYSTHPSPSDRIASLDKQMGKEMEIFGGQATLQDRFVTMILGTAPPPEKKPAAPAKAPAKAPPKSS
jgi:predicted Zn-dependent protease